MSTSLLDLGYISFRLNSGWIACTRLDIDIAYFNLTRGSAKCDMTLLSSGNSPQTNLDKLYEQALRDVRNRGLHFDDLVEDFDYELIAEIEGERDFFGVQHIFIRLCSQVIVFATLTDFDSEDEEEIRQMLATLEPGAEPIASDEFTPLPKSQAIYDWDHVGQLAVFNRLAQ
jgi:hypothetical protein